MKNLISRIIVNLMEIPNMTKQMIKSIINPLQTENQMKRLLKYLEANKGNNNLLNFDNLLNVRTEIVKDN